jgi:hypothetical protein
MRGKSRTYRQPTPLTFSVYDRKLKVGDLKKIETGTRQVGDSPRIGGSKTYHSRVCIECPARPKPFARQGNRSRMPSLRHLTRTGLPQKQSHELFASLQAAPEGFGRFGAPLRGCFHPSIQPFLPGLANIVCPGNQVPYRQGPGKASH